ncbi:hypothetical protein [Salinicola acroporae]|nr:hypothetical protein [Salinicola acroporae]
MASHPAAPAYYIAALAALGVVIGLFLLRAPSGQRLALMQN